MKRVAVFGGGMGGLSVAHELIERGFTVDVYERRRLWGGKARSYGVKNTGKDGRENLPAEHGFRFFPGFYKHIPDTMSRIPYPNLTSSTNVEANLVQCLCGELLQADRKTTIFPVRFPRSLAELRDRYRDLKDHGPIGFRPHELRFFLGRMLRIAVSCQDRRMSDYEMEAWWDFVDAKPKSEAYKNILARGLTRSLVAMRAETASTRTVGDIMLQMIFYALTPHVSSDRVLNGPTSEVWIDPWRAYLASRGVTFHGETKLVRFELGADRRIAAAIVKPTVGVESVVEADHYVAAVPVEVMAPLVLGPIADAAPSLQRLGKLEVQWMNGVQFYLGRDVPMVFGHSLYSSSSWSLTSISQPQFWREGGRLMDRYGDGRVQGLLSVDISDWTTPGQYTTNETADHCSRDEVVTEAWAQVKAHIVDSGHGPVTDADLLLSHLDHDIEDPNHVASDAKREQLSALRRRTPVEQLLSYTDQGRYTDPHPVLPGRVMDIDVEPLLVNTIGSWSYRPHAHTEIPNLFLASDYVRTNTDLATMEGANEAGRRAANAILDAVGSTQPRAEIFPLKEPWILAPFRAIDWVLFHLSGPRGASSATGT